jgi:tetratricopeptide (TPR) repeat protein
MQSAEQLLVKGISLYQEGELHESARCLEACVRECQRARDEDLELLAMSNLSEAYMRLGRLVDAEHASVALLAISKQRRSPENEVRAIGRLAMALLAQEMSSRWADLRPQLEHAVKMARDIRLDYWVTQNLETLGCFAVRSGEIADGFEWLQMALNSTVNVSVEADFFRTRIYGGIAEVMVKAMKPQRAREYSDLAARTAVSVGSRHLAVVSQLCKARVELGLDGLQEARQCALRVRISAARENWKIEQLAAEKLLIAIFESLAQYDDAREAAHRALLLANEAGLMEEMSARLIDLGRIYRTGGEDGEAGRYLRRAYDLAQKLGRSDLVERAKIEMQSMASRKRNDQTCAAQDKNEVLR